MISYEEATELVLKSVSKLGRINLELVKAQGYVLADNIVSPVDVAPFRNSAMDGFAISSEQLKNCSLENPVALPIEATIFAGDACGEIQSKESAVRVMTGAPVPSGCDCVVKLEDTKSSKQQVTFSKPAESGENIRPAAEDIVKGQTLYSSGHRIETFDIGILASIGLRKAQVFEKPSLQVVITGDELVEPGEKLRPGQIYNSNKYTLASMLCGFCNKMEVISTVHDTFESLNAVLNCEQNVIVTTGGVSVGERDLLPTAAEANGWETVFHKVSIKPGKPVYFARKQNQLLFGLPGNPLSAAITCALFVIPALKKMAGYRQFQLQPIPASLRNSPGRKSDRTIIWPGKIWNRGKQTVASFSSKKSSAALSALLGSDGMIFQRDHNSAEVEVVTWVQVFNR